MNTASTTRSIAAIVAVLCAAPLCLRSQQPIAPKSQEQQKPATAEQAKADANKKPAERGDVVDRILAIVNGDIVLQSDLEEEERWSKLYPYRITAGTSEEDQAMRRLIDRDLILQQMRGVQPAVSDEDIRKAETDLRADLPACLKIDCKSEAGWKRFLEEDGFTEDELHQRLQLRIQVLRFIEQRFRNGTRISDAEIEDFYKNTMLPQYQKVHATPPPLDSVSQRIEDLLLERKVSSQLDDWLKSLRDSGGVRILKEGEDAP